MFRPTSHQECAPDDGGLRVLLLREGISENTHLLLYFLKPLEEEW